jgi:LuxR family maltose regulon positive regulatory protein
LALLEPLRRQAEAKAWHNDRLGVMILQALAHHLHGATEPAAGVLGEALTLAEPEGIIRVFVDEGDSMAQLLSAAVARGDLPAYASKVLAGFATEGQALQTVAPPPPPPAVLSGPDALSQREREVLRLIAQGLSNRDISERLFLALSTVKGHNQKIFEKLQVKRRTEALARARELGLI